MLFKRKHFLHVTCEIYVERHLHFWQQIYIVYTIICFIILLKHKGRINT